MSDLTVSEKSKSTFTWRPWLAAVGISLLVFGILTLVAASRGYAIISVDDHMRYYLSTTLFDSNAVTESDMRDDLYYWPWGQYALTKAGYLLFGLVGPEAAGAVLAHWVFGVLAIVAMAFLTRALGGGPLAALLTCGALATLPWTVSLSLAILSDMPCAAAIIWGLACHAWAMRESRDGPLSRKWLFLGDLGYAIAMSMRYEAWVLAAIAGISTTFFLWRRRDFSGWRFWVFTLERAAIHSVFPIFWLSLQWFRFHGDPFFFQKIAASRSSESLGFLGEVKFALRASMSHLNLFSWALIGVAGLFALTSWRDVREALKPGFRNPIGFPLIIVMALTILGIYVYSSARMGHPSNLPERLVYIPVILGLPLVGILAAHRIRGMGMRIQTGFIGFLLVVSSWNTIEHLTSQPPYREGMPLELAAALEKEREAYGYGKDFEIFFEMSWEKNYPSIFIPMTRLRRLSFDYQGYSGEPQPGAVLPEGIQPGRTLFVMTDNPYTVDSLLEKYPRAGLYREIDVWYLVDLRQGVEHGLDARLSNSPRVEILNSAEQE